jgi:hypothetical protein
VIDMWCWCWSAIYTFNSSEWNVFWR